MVHILHHCPVPPGACRYVDPYALTRELQSAFSTYRNYSVISVGFNGATRAYTNPGAPLADNKLTVDPFTTEQLQNK